MLNVETKIENDIVIILQKLGIQSSIKTDKKSLPHKELFEGILKRNKTFSEDFRYTFIYRNFIKEILNKGYNKIRFYCELVGEEEYEKKEYPIPIPSYKCYIKYYPHY